MMAGLAKRFSCQQLLKCLMSKPTLRWQTTSHTLSVRQRIQEKRDQALLGGGAKRIAAQHKKVGGTENLVVVEKVTRVVGSPLHS